MNKLNTLKNFRHTQQGITLIEVSIGLLIAAIVAAAAFVAFQSNSRRQEVQENVAEISVQIGEAQQKYGRTVNFDGVITTLAINSGTIEQLNSYGGLVCLTGSNNFVPADGLPTALSGNTTCPTADNATAPANTNIAVLQWMEVPTSQCIDLVTATLDGARDVYVGTTNVRANGVNNVANIQDACDNTDRLTVAWTIEQR